MKKNKRFDCVEMKRNGALKIHEQLEGRSFEEQVEYWRKRAEEFRRNDPASKNSRKQPQAQPQ